jgi:methylenetetrahydrofolate reductase (NADPH)
MKVTEHLANADSTIFSFEILPPMKGKSYVDLIGHIEPLMEYKPKFVDVTYHREEFVYKKHTSGLLEKKSVRKRPGTVGICAAIMNRFQVDTVPHIICGGFTKEETEYALIDLNFLGIDNVLALRGDAVKNEGSFQPTEGGNNYAIDLVSQIADLNKGQYLDEELQNSSSSNFCIGVAGYPEKHFEAPNINSDIKYLKKKVEMGAEYIVTQMFYDNQKYFEFVELCRKNDINVPIIPGIKPLTTISQLSILPRIFHIDIPEDLSNAVESCKNNDEVKQVGIEWGIEQCKELIKNKVPSLHFYTMGKAKSTQAIMKGIF